jgi:LPXTG-motif cell wall-anchored protein
MEMKRLLAATAALGAAFALNVLPAAAQTETYPPPTNPQPTVQPSVETTVPTTPPTVLPSVETVPETGGSTLPVTGGDVAGMAAIGVGAVAAGAALLFMRRRREGNVAV